MTEQDKALAVQLVKQRLNRLPEDTSLDDYLTARVAAAAGELEALGIRLVMGDLPDILLVVDTAVWQYQCRDKETGMPDWLRLRRRERYLRERRGQA